MADFPAAVVLGVGQHSTAAVPDAGRLPASVSMAPLLAPHTVATLRSLLPATTVTWSSSSDFPDGLLPRTHPAAADAHL